MNNTKQNILSNVRTFVMCWLALGWLLAVAYGQESGKRGAKTKESAAPEILSVRPIGMNGEPHLQPGKQVILLGRNFSPVLIKNRVSLRTVTDNPQTPPLPRLPTTPYGIAKESSSIEHPATSTYQGHQVQASLPGIGGES